MGKMGKIFGCVSHIGYMGVDGGKKAMSPLLSKGDLSGKNEGKGKESLTPVTFPILQSNFFFFLKSFLPEHKLIKVYQMSVETWSIHAGKFYLISYCHPAAAAHSGSIHHN